MAFSGGLLPTYRTIEIIYFSARAFFLLSASTHFAQKRVATSTLSLLSILTYPWRIFCWIFGIKQDQGNSAEETEPLLRETSPDSRTAAASSRNTLNSRADDVLKPKIKTKELKKDSKNTNSKKTSQTVTKSKSTTTNMSYYVLPLNNDGAPRPLGKGSLISLPVPDPSYHLRLVVSSVSEISRNGKILTNVPKKGDDFDRKKYQAFE